MAIFDFRTISFDTQLAWKFKKKFLTVFINNFKTNYQGLGEPNLLKIRDLVIDPENQAKVRSPTIAKKNVTDPKPKKKGIVAVKLHTKQKSCPIQRPYPRHQTLEEKGKATRLCLLLVLHLKIRPKIQVRALLLIL